MENVYIVNVHWKQCCIVWAVLKLVNLEPEKEILPNNAHSLANRQP